jgi:hypothetical protein
MPSRNSKWRHALPSTDEKDFLNYRDMRVPLLDRANLFITGWPGINVTGFGTNPLADNLQRFSSPRVPVGHRRWALCLHHCTRRSTNRRSPYRCNRTANGGKYPGYYLIPGTIVQVIKEDPASGTSEMRSGKINRSLGPTVLPNVQQLGLGRDKNL